MFEKFRTNARIALAQNLEKCGRTQDAARVYEDLRMYDKSRELRERDRQIIVKKTDVSINLNALLQQIKGRRGRSRFPLPTLRRQVENQRQNHHELAEDL